MKPFPSKIKVRFLVPAVQKATLYINLSWLAIMTIFALCDQITVFQ